MGLFDNFIKQIDDGLKAVENGALEERLNKFADSIDKTSQKAESTLNKAVDKPEELMKKAETTVNQLENKAKDIGNQARRSIDIVQG